MNKLIANYNRGLLDIGVKPNLKGFKYLGMAFTLIDEDVSYLYSVLTLYNKIAAECNDPSVTVSMVERCIRHAIHRTYDQLDEATIHEIFGQTLRGRAQKKNSGPTNSEFIAAFYRYYHRIYRGTNHEKI